MSDDIQKGPPEDSQTHLIKMQELEKLLRISKRSIWRRLSSGEMIEPVRLGRCVRWRRAEIEAWLQAGCPKVGKAK